VVEGAGGSAGPAGECNCEGDERMIIGNLINVTNDDLTLIFTGVVAASTVVYAILTWKLVSETQKMREAQTEPKISVYVESNPKYHILKNLVIRNVGLGSAYNIKFSNFPDFKIFGGKKLGELKIIKNGIPHLPPNNSYEFVFTNLREDFEENAKYPFDITVEYQNSMKKEYSDSFEIDFSIWENLQYIPEEGLNEVKIELSGINRSLEQIAHNIQKR
jgi:hypothetical protein